MKKISREEMLKKLNENKKLHLFNEYYAFNGKSTIKYSYQVLQGWAAEHTSKNNEYFYVVDGGFATEYIYKKIFS